MHTALKTSKNLFSLLPHITAEEKTRIERALEMAMHAHEGQLRKSGEPYFNHLIGAAEILAEFDMDTDTVIAGILHDSLEDTTLRPEEIKKEFGPTVLFLVEGVTKLGKLKYYGAERHVESLRKLFVAMAHDIRVIIVKLADRLHNIRTLEFVPKEKRKRIALETLMIHARIADRLGMGKLKAELEDGSFPYVYPKEWAETKKLLEENKHTKEERLEKFSREIAKDVAESGVKIIKKDFRVKHLYSFWKKLGEKKGDSNKIYDLVALRFIVPTVEDCYRALGAIHARYQPLPGRIKDYIALPKMNGYRSLHTTIFTGEGGVLEIQIRTQEMHDEAEYGVASHLTYKEIGKGLDKETLERKTGWTKELLRWQEEAAQAEEFLKHLQIDFFEDRVFIFTPRGEVVDLPQGATSIDFAYAIHSDIGDHMAGTKINGKLVSIETPLKQSDIVEIIVKDSAKPKQKWIDYAKTSLAKRHIKSFLENDRRLRR